MSYSDETSDTIAARGEEIYQQDCEELEAQRKGQFFVVDIEAENYEIADEGIKKENGIVNFASRKQKFCSSGISAID